MIKVLLDLSADAGLCWEISMLVDFLPRIGEEISFAANELDGIERDMSPYFKVIDVCHRVRPGWPGSTVVCVVYARIEEIV